MAQANRQGWQIRVRGLVQGVGFRPKVWKLATDSGLTGEVLNDAEGVLIRLACSRDAVDQFIIELGQQAPVLSRIDAMEITALTDELNVDGFTIVPSQPGLARTSIVPDAATCSDCLADIKDPENRRFNYAFTNCTNCGPRLSIIRGIPYDRANTSMSDFVMCAACQREYRDPSDRRFHAQPNACPDCGPQLALVDGAGQRQMGDAVSGAATALKAGKIVAIKGIGGFQLACDATNAAAVALLRNRKRRVAKPFAIMARDLRQITQYVELSEAAQTILNSPEAPIVLAPLRRDRAELAAGIAPQQNRLGFMLPNSPLHHLLLAQVPGPLVMTSGNPSGEPQVTGNAEALSRLAGLADLWLQHDRDIVNRLDDSVVQIVGGQTQILRRARGYAPAPLQLHPGFSDAPPVLATGADIKNTFCLLKDGQAIVSQHLGDMQSDRTHRDFRRNLTLFSQTHDFVPATVAIDMHPGYFATELGREQAANHNAELLEVQHHHAHVAAVLAEHGFGPDTAPVLAIVLDGLGWGADGTIWGGEILQANFHSFRRLSHFPAIALAGGEKANQQPWRNTLAHLQMVFGADPVSEINAQYGALPVVEKLRQKPCVQILQMIDRGLNCPLASSAGRLFDAVAGALDLCFDQISFEGQAALKLQNLAEQAASETGEYTVETTSVLRWNGLWHGILSDMKTGQTPSCIAAKFHNTLIAVLSKIALEQSVTQPTQTVVLAGGVFQNALLLEGVRTRLTNAGITVLTPQKFPANDGAIALGQATIAAARVQDNLGKY
jgi:hydrogenase maturation protein HypF